MGRFLLEESEWVKGKGEREDLPLGTEAAEKKRQGEKGKETERQRDRQCIIKRERKKEQYNNFFFWFFETGFLCGFGTCPKTSSFRPGWS